MRVQHDGFLDAMKIVATGHSHYPTHSQFVVVEPLDYQLLGEDNKDGHNVYLKKCIIVLHLGKNATTTKSKLGEVCYKVHLETTNSMPKSVLGEEINMAKK